MIAMMVSTNKIVLKNIMIPMGPIKYFSVANLSEKFILVGKTVWLIK